MREWPQKFWLTMILIGMLLFALNLVAGCAPTPTPTATPAQFSYQVRVEVKDTGEYVGGAKVKIEVGEQAPLRYVTDSDGLARIRIASSYAGKPGFLIVEAEGYMRHERNIDLVKDTLPNVVQLERIPTPTSIATPTRIPTATSTSTLTPQIPIVSPSPTPTLLLAAFTGKVCMIRSGWDTSTIFLRQAEFEALGLPIGTRVTVTVLDIGKSVENVTLSLDSDLKICSVRLAKPLRDSLGIDVDTDIQSESGRPDRQFDIIQTSPPINRESTNFGGKVCMIKAGQDTTTIFLRQAEFDAFGVPAGTTVSVTVFDTEKIVEKVTLGLDSDLAICTVRLPKSYREALGVADDTNIQPPENRPGRQFSIRLLQP